MIDYVLLGYSVSAIAIVIGITIACYFVVVKYCHSPCSHIETSTCSIIASIIYLAVAGLLLVLLPVGYRRFFAYFPVLIPVVYGISKLCGIRKDLASSFVRSRDFIYIGGAILFSIVLVLIASIRLPLPEMLPDGAYVNKEHVSAVRIQFLTGNLPADNVVPYVAQEYLARDISFVHNNPILPGQQVTNRPILVSLISLPIRLVLRPIEELENLPTYNYVGVDWPDFRVLVRDESTFAAFLGVGVFLNACLLLGVGLFATSLPHSNRRLDVLLLALFVTSPYFIFQTLFTWPKSLAGFFILAAAYFYFKNKNAVVSGVLIGLAYLSHPYAVGYLLVASAMLLLNLTETLKTRIASSIKLWFSFLTVLLPWFVWAKFIVGIDSNLVEQNFSFGGTTFYQFGWTRSANLMNAIFPTHLLTHGKDFVSMFSSSAFNLVGAVGTIYVFTIALTRLVPFKQATADLHSSELDQGGLQSIRLTLLFLALSSLLLTFVFSNPAVPLVHGWQPLAALILVLGIHWGSQSVRIVERLCWAQVFVNAIAFPLYYFGLWGRLTF